MLANKIIEGAVICNDKIIIQVQIEIINNYHRSSVGKSEGKPGFTIVNRQRPSVLGTCGYSIMSSSGQYDLMAYASRLAFLWMRDGVISRSNIDSY